MTRESNGSKRALWIAFVIVACSGESEDRGPTRVEQPEAKPVAPLTSPTERFVAPDGEPIHPRCVTSAWERGSVAIEECQHAPGELTTANGVITFLPAADPAEEELGIDTGQEDYGVLGRVGDGFAVSVTMNGGGTGYFTAVLVLSLAGDRVTRSAQTESGDRCNGGLISARVYGGVIEYVVWMTPPELLAMSAEGRRLGVAAPELEDSAMSCFARGTYRWTGESPTLVAVELEDPVPDDQPGWTDDYRHQACFNAWMADEMLRRRKLFPPDFDGFARGFAARCLHSP